MSEADPPAEGQAADETKKASGILGDLLRERASAGEGRVAVAGLIVFVVWLLFDVVFQIYGLNNVLAVLGIAAYVVPKVNEERFQPVPRSLLTKALGYSIAVFGVIELILDLRNGILFDGAAALGAVPGYLAYFLAFSGARAIKSPDASSDE